MSMRRSITDAMRRVFFRMPEAIPIEVDFSTLQLRRGDVLILRPARWPGKEELRTMRKVLSHLLKDRGCTGLILPPGTEVEVVSSVEFEERDDQRGDRDGNGERPAPFGAQKLQNSG